MGPWEGKPQCPLLLSCTFLIHGPVEVGVPLHVLPFPARRTLDLILVQDLLPVLWDKVGIPTKQSPKKKKNRVVLTLAAPCQLPSALLAVPTPGQAAGQPPVSTNGVKPKALHPQPCLVTPQPLPADPTPSLPRRCRHRPFGSTAPRAAGPGSQKPPPRSSGARRPPRAAAWGAAAVRAEPTQTL